MIKKISTIKFKAGALQYTIFISVVIALLVFAFISLTYVKQKLRIKASFFEDVVKTTDQGFYYLAKNEIPYNIQTQLIVADENMPEIGALKKHWGIFDITTISSEKGKEKFIKTALLGGQREEKPALYLVDEFQPLVVVGSTQIEGKAYLPLHGIKRGSIAGHSYQGTQLIYGPIAQSGNKLPEFENLEYIRIIKDQILTKEGNIYIDLIENTRLVNSFDEPVKIISAFEPIELQYIELIGNVIIHSDSKITIYPSAKLQDIILIAPEIEVMNEVRGNFQAFGERKISVGKNCLLKYPSTLILNEGIGANLQRQPADSKNINQISIGTHSEVRGIVAFLSEETTASSNYDPQIVIEDNTTIMGEVYCNQNIELKGTVKGSIYTKGFIANQFGSIYKNHIYNGNILSNDLPKQYSGLSLKKSKATVVKWLNY